MSVRTSFEERFGAEQADKLYAAAVGHSNGVHDRPGSDPFRWAVAIAIGYQCAEVDSYRASHGITAPWPEVQQWIKDEADLAHHDGDVDYLSLFAGVYDNYAGIKR